MSNDLRPYADLTDALFAMAVRDFAEFTLANTGTSLSDIEDGLPFLRAEILGGSGGRLQRTSLVDLEVFATTYRQSLSLSERLSAYLLGYPRSVTLDERLVVLDMVVETRPPVEMPWDDSQIRRHAATYQISVRR